MSMENRDARRPDPRRIHTREEFAGGLSTLCHRARHTVRSLATELDVPKSTIGGYLAGTHRPPLHRGEEFGQMLTALGVHDAEEREEWSLALQRIWKNGDRRLDRRSRAGRPDLGLAG